MTTERFKPGDVVKSAIRPDKPVRGIVKGVFPPGHRFEGYYRVVWNTSSRGTEDPHEDEDLELAHG